MQHCVRHDCWNGFIYCVQLCAHLWPHHMTPSRACMGAQLLPISAITRFPLEQHLVHHQGKIVCSTEAGCYFNLPSSLYQGEHIICAPQVADARQAELGAVGVRQRAMSPGSARIMAQQVGRPSCVGYMRRAALPCSLCPAMSSKPGFCAGRRNP